MNKKGTNNFAQSFRKAAPYLSSIYALMASIGIFGYVGYWADTRYETRPIFLLIGLFLGLGIGFYQFYKVLMKQEDQE
jgi:F0F1-type ATP synthase assembly protein I